MQNYLVQFVNGAVEDMRGDIQGKNIIISGGLKGFLDGYYGFVVCVLSSYATFLRYAKLKQLHKNRNIEEN